MENIPPILDALMQHLKCVAYQSGIWCTCEQSEHMQLLQKVGAGQWTLDDDSH